MTATVLMAMQFITFDARADWTASAELNKSTWYSGESFTFAITYTNTGESTVTIHYASGEIDWGTEVEHYYSLMGLEETLAPGDSMMLDPAIIGGVPDVPEGTYTLAVTVGGTNPSDEVFVPIEWKTFDLPFQVRHAPPIENVTLDASTFSGQAPLTVGFSASSTGGLPDSVFYMWTFGDGNESFEQSPQHTYTEPGTYGVVVWISDASNHPVNKTVNVTVLPKSTAGLDGPGQSPDNAVLYLAMVGAAAAVIAVSFIYLSRKSKPPS
jgi:PKD repeat protein